MESFSTDAVNSLTNIISLCINIHRISDERHFCSLPKPDKDSAEGLPLRTRGGDISILTDILINEELLPNTNNHDSGKAS
jgi:hypothetical protein